MPFYISKFANKVLGFIISVILTLMTGVKAPKLEKPYGQVFTLEEIEEVLIVFVLVRYMFH